MSNSLTAIIAGEAWIDARLRAHSGLAGCRIGKVGEMEAGRDEIVVGYGYMAGFSIRLNGDRYAESMAFQITAEGPARNLAGLAQALRAIGQALEPSFGVPPNGVTEFGTVTMCALEREVDLPTRVDGVPYQRAGGIYRLHVIPA